MNTPASTIPFDAMTPGELRAELRRHGARLEIVEKLAVVVEFPTPQLPESLLNAVSDNCGALLEELQNRSRQAGEVDFLYSKLWHERRAKALGDDGEEEFIF